MIFGGPRRKFTTSEVNIKWQLHVYYMDFYYMAETPWGLDTTESVNLIG